MNWDAWCIRAPLRPYYLQLQKGWGTYVDYDGGCQTCGVTDVPSH
jgi:hypothetical protein